MNGSKPGSRNSRRRRIKVAPVTRAVRIALAASAAAFALAGSGAAFAQSCTGTPPSPVLCDGVFTDSIDISTVEDLTLVLGSVDPTTSVTASPGESAIDVNTGFVGDAVIQNYAALTSYGYSAIQADVGGYLSIYTSGDISVGSDYYALAAIDANSTFDLTVVNSGYIHSEGHTEITGIDADSLAGNVTASNSGDIAISTDSGAFGISGDAGGDVSEDNTGSMVLDTVNGSAIGLYAYSMTGDASVTNDGLIDVSTEDANGVADGMFASGVNVTASNGADAYIYSEGYGWTAGIEAEGRDSTQVTNAGYIGAQDDSAGGHAYGIFATGGADADGYHTQGANGVDIQNDGDVYATATQYGWATGLFATGLGDVDVANTGTVEAQALAGFATGIHADSTYAGSNASVNNGGGVEAHGYYAGTGIEALATGAGGSASVANTGGISVSQQNKYGYGANGIVASGDLDATIDNSGSIEVESAGMAYGATALAFNGVASITNSGDVDVSSTAFYYYGAYGLVASSSNGTAVVDNSGTVEAYALYYGHGIQASGTAGTTVTNSGTITADAFKAYGVLATAGNGDVNVTNTSDGGIYVHYLEGQYVGRAYGVVALSTAGDASITNEGTVSVWLDGNVYGLIAVADEGDATIVNEGPLEADAANNDTHDSEGNAFGIIARADQGTATVSGGAGVRSEYGNVYGIEAIGDVANVTTNGIMAYTNGPVAVGVLASATSSASVDNDGGMRIFGTDFAAGIYATSDGDVSVSNGVHGNIEVNAVGGTAMGIAAFADAGNVAIDNVGDVDSEGYGAVYGLYATSNGGDVAIDNSGYAWARSNVGASHGILGASYQGSVAIDNDGGAVAQGWGGTTVAVGAYSVYGNSSVDNAGDVTATQFSAGDGNAIGINAAAGGNATVYNTGSIEANAIYAVSSTSGTVGIQASGATVHVDNGGSITTQGPNATGIAAFGHLVYVSSEGSIEATASYKYGQAIGVYATGDSAANISTGADGSIAAMSNQGYAIAIDGFSSAGDISIVNAGEVTAGGALGGYGIAAMTETGGISLSNSGYVGAGSVGKAFGIYGASQDGAIALANSGEVYTTSLYGPSMGMRAYAINGDVTLENTGSLDAEAENYWAIGMYAYSMYGNAHVVNDGEIVASSEYSLADGVFASGVGVTVSAGADSNISATGYDWAAGIDAKGSDSTVVDNDGVIKVTSTDAGSRAMGIYAATAGSGGLTVDNGGPITAMGYFASGIYARGGGTGTVTNSGDITAGDVYTVDYNGETYVYGSATGTGIHLDDQGQAGSTLAVANSGAITAEGYFAGTGIEVVASGAGSAAGASNTGDISVSQYTKYGYGTAGIVVSADGDSSVTNSGSIDAVSAGAAYGAEALSIEGEASVSNDGDITVSNSAFRYYGAYGVLASSAQGTAVADNSGSIDVTGSYLGWGVYAQGMYGATATNSGDITSNGKYAYGVMTSSASGAALSSNAGSIAISSLYGTGIKASSTTGSATATNAGDISVDAYGAYGVLAVSEDGAAVANNVAGGTISAVYSYYNYGGIAFGVGAIGTNGTATAGNAGTIYTFTGGQTAGLAAVSDYGTGASADNSGDIEANSYAGIATGAFARADAGIASVVNSGSLVANSPGYVAYGARAVGDTASVTNSGDITVNGFYAGYGVDAEGNAASVSNSGAITANGYFAASGVFVYGADAASLDNGGDISAVSSDFLSYGASVQSNHGDVAVDNSGTIQASGGDQNTGLRAYSREGHVEIDNSGSISAGSGYMSYGISAEGYSVAITNSGDVEAAEGTAISASAAYDLSLVNDGTISGSVWLQSFDGSIDIGGSGSVDGYFDANAAHDLTLTGSNDFAHGLDLAASGDIYAVTGGDIGGEVYARAGNIDFTNTGDVATESDFSLGALRFDAEDAVRFQNSGSIEVTGGTTLTKGVVLRGADATLVNSGSLEVSGDYYALGAYVVSLEGTASAQNSGTIAADASQGQATAINVLSAYADAEFANSGHITARTDLYYGLGARVFSSGDTGLQNSGSISAYGPDALGASVLSLGGASIANSGHIEAFGDDYAAGLQVRAAGDVTVTNSGTISAEAGSGTIALAVDYADSAHVTNSGTIVATGAGDADYAVSVDWDTPLVLDNSGTITGAIRSSGGDDVVNNAAGGTWNVTNHATDFGDGANVLHNLAGGTVALADGAIYFGDGAENSFVNDGTITVSGDSSIHMSGSSSQQGFGPLAMSVVPLDAPATPFENNGIIDFADGNATDILTITGDFAGQGDINLDVNLLNGTSDLLYIDGDVVDGTQQTVNLSVDSIGDVVNPTPAQFLSVSGTVANGAFVPGEVTGFGTGNFIDLDVQLTPTTENGVTVFSANVAVAGLNSTGVLAANIMPGAQQLIASSIGTLRWRNGAGMAPGKFGAWLRVFDNDGDVNPAHTQDFGSAGDFAFSQSSHGTELGMGYDLDGPLQFGVMLGKSDATQKMRDGSGSDHFKLNTAGVYGTWATPAFYVDASYRRMSFDARLNSSAGEQDTSGDADAWNFEAGYTGWNFGGFNVVPQVQYTIARVDGVDPVKGSITDFVSSDSTSERSRLGVEINRSFQAGAVAWTPYLAASTVHESDGKASYKIADTFSGTTDTGGSSTLLEAGVGATFGAFRATLGANWSDGGVQDGISGGQLVLRYNW